MGPMPSFEELLLDFWLGFAESPELAAPVVEEPFAAEVVSEPPEELPLDADVRLVAVVGFAREDAEETVEAEAEEAEEITDPDSPVGVAAVPI